MKIFIPGKIQVNTFFDEILLYSKTEFIFGKYTEFEFNLYDGILIQWPESIFNWREPNKEDVNLLASAITEWKKTTVLVYLVHNLENHLGINPIFKSLYKLIEENCDVIVHMGQFSYDHMKKKYPEKNHEIIPHPLYKNTFAKLGKKEARIKLGISNEAKVITAAGKIRNFDERRMILKAFNSLPIKNKVLISPLMLWKEPKIKFPGRLKLKGVWDVKKWLEKLLNNYQKPQYFFNYSYLSQEDYSLMISAADVVLIPRTNLLNSGNVFLGLTYEKVIVGPNKGNVTEILDKFNLPMFDPKDLKSVTKSLKLGLEISNDSFYYNKKDKLADFEPKKIARQWDELIGKIAKIK